MKRAIVVSPSAEVRIGRARTWLCALRRTQPALVVGGTIEGANALVRQVVRERGAVLGWHRTTLSRLAATLAATDLASRELAPIGPLAREAVVARIVQRLGDDGRLGRFAPVAGRPGLPRAMATTFDELRLSGVSPDDLPVTVADLAYVFRHYISELGALGLADRADVLRSAARVAGGEASPIPVAGLPVLLLDTRIPSQAARLFLAALAARAPAVLATCQAGDRRSLAHLVAALRVQPETVDSPGGTMLGSAMLGSTMLSRVQNRLFEKSPGPEGTEPALVDTEPSNDGSVEFLSAPGEGRECVEIARLALREARAGTPFDRMAILLRAPGQYRAYVFEALRRAGIPAYHAEGARQPDPGGRALLALLSCTAEGLSARRFGEYLSLGEVPGEGAPPPAAHLWVPPDEELLSQALHNAAAEHSGSGDPEPASVADWLVAPRRWEQLLVDAAVIGGLDRWKRRLPGLEADLRRRIGALDDPAGPAADYLEKTLEELGGFSRFALPIVEELDALPRVAVWGEWLDLLGALAARALRNPDRVLRILGELRPMSNVGPVSLDEVRLVLSRRLTELTVRPAGSTAGKLFVGPVEDARGLAFDVVFVPGLAERIFPQRVSDDPILLDFDRRTIPFELDTSRDRVTDERLALRLAAGAATRRLVLSYPRIDLEAARPRVPSFYGLEVIQAAEGRLPGFEELARRAGRGGAPRIGWPAPEDPADAVDEAEHDLALLSRLLQSEPDTGARGAARFLLEANPHLGRALRGRYLRFWDRKWTPFDGLVEPAPEARAALEAHSLESRSFSATALQQLAQCPYKFVLYTIHKLQPREEPAAVEEMDALQRGSLIHDVQFRLLSRLRDEGIGRIDAASIEHARRHLEAVLLEVVSEYEEKLAPAIDRVWKDGVAAIRADVREWLARMLDEHEWWPWRFELAFGLHDTEAQRDPDSVRHAVRLECGLELRGAIDLVETNLRGQLRATDYKTGRTTVSAGAIMDGGEALQPVLYALALEALFGDREVAGGRLYYCTARGQFQERVIRLDDEARRSAAVVAEVAGAALRRGFFPAAPKPDACRYCDYRPVCGDVEEQRTARKPRAELADVDRLRSMR